MAEYITELANDIAKSCPDLVENGCGNDNCVACLAFKLIGLGYTKQSDTADVVPKSEVEYWKEQCFHACMHNGCLDFAKIKAEIAREIFEEIEKCTLRKIIKDGEVVYDTTEQFDRVKKKYTEGK